MPTAGEVNADTITAALAEATQALHALEHQVAQLHTQIHQYQERATQLQEFVRLGHRVLGDAPPPPVETSSGAEVYQALNEQPAALPPSTATAYAQQALAETENAPSVPQSTGIIPSAQAAPPQSLTGCILDIVATTPTPLAPGAIHQAMLARGLSITRPSLAGILSTLVQRQRIHRPAPGLYTAMPCAPL